MSQRKRKCRICDPKYRDVAVFMVGVDEFTPPNMLRGEINMPTTKCPLCEGTGKIDSIRWIAYHLLATNGKPTYEEIVAMVANLNSVCANEIDKSLDDS